MRTWTRIKRPWKTCRSLGLRNFKRRKPVIKKFKSSILKRKRIEKPHISLILMKILN